MDDILKICVFSDSHGHTSQIEGTLKSLDKVVDAFWFLGDYAKDASALKRVLKSDFFIVKGNCDLQSNEPEELILEVEGKRVLLTHGHHYGVKYGLTTLYLKAKSEEVDLVCFGHTHTAVSILEDGIHFFNPGSPTSPRGRQAASIGLITIDEHGIDCEYLWI